MSESKKLLLYVMEDTECRFPRYYLVVSETEVEFPKDSPQYVLAELLAEVKSTCLSMEELKNILDELEA